MNLKSKYTAIIVFFISAFLFTDVFILDAAPRRRRHKIGMRVVLDDSIAPGIRHKTVKIGNRRLKLLIHTIEIDFSDTNNVFVMLKAKDNSSELEKLHGMINRRDSAHNDYDVIAAVNGSYWRAYHNYPIGPTVIDGEVVEFDNRGSWNSAFVTEHNLIYIDNFKTDAFIKTKNGTRFELEHVNRRNDTTGIVLYNRFVGDTVPYISGRRLKDALEDALDDTLYTDSTEYGFDTTQFKNYLLKNERDSSLEAGMKKVVLKYLNPPAINRETYCQVVKVADSGAVAVPRNGCVLTIPECLDSSFIAAVGDTLLLKYSTNKMKDTVFTNAVCGTPILMRRGRSRFEGPQAHGRSRFKYKELPRTGIGTNKAHNKLYLVSSIGTHKSSGIKGCTLENFAYAMKRLGIYDSINLDGGGSTVMVLNGRNVLSCPKCSRKVSVGVGAARRKDKNLDEAYKTE